MKLLERLYYDASNPAGYSGARNLLRAARGKVSRDKVLQWLKAQDAYTLHKPIRRKFPRSHYNVANIDDLWEADLVDLKSLKEYNDGFSYLLVVVDVLSKYAWVEPLRNKTADVVTEAFKHILSTSKSTSPTISTTINRSPVYLQTDRGKEFIGAPFQKFLTENDIRFRIAGNPDIKASIVERFNRTLKERMWRYFTHKNTHRYIDVLPQIVRSYNHTIHSTIKMTPASVTLDSAPLARLNLQRRFKKHPRGPKFRTGEVVRISKTKGVFDKGYKANWSEELFKIQRVIARKPPVYLLRDLAGEDIEGNFYEAELQSVNKDIDETEFKINKILGSKGRGASKQLFVSWVGYPEKFNSWIPASNIKSLK